MVSGLNAVAALVVGFVLPRYGWRAVFFLGVLPAFFTLWETSLQEHIPEASISRVTSYDYAASAGTIPIGNVTPFTVVTEAAIAGWTAIPVSVTAVAAISILKLSMINFLNSATLLQFTRSSCHSTLVNDLW